MTKVSIISGELKIVHLKGRVKVGRPRQALCRALSLSGRSHDFINAHGKRAFEKARTSQGQANGSPTLPTPPYLIYRDFLDSIDGILSVANQHTVFLESDLYASREASRNPEGRSSTQYCASGAFETSQPFCVAPTLPPLRRRCHLRSFFSITASSTPTISSRTISFA